MIPTFVERAIKVDISMPTGVSLQTIGPAKPPVPKTSKEEGFVAPLGDAPR